MCNDPATIRLQSGREISAPCRKCRSCISDKINDVTARTICEAEEREWAVVVTLTYRDQQDGSHELLNPPHFQKAIQRLRDQLRAKAKKTKSNTGSVVKYLVAGEYGELRGRAHFHVVLMGDGPKPDLPQKTRCWPSWWPYGHVYADWKVDAKAVRYVAKYLHKWDNNKSWSSRSQGEPLGWPHLKKKLERYVEAGKWPTTWLYRVPGWKKMGRMSDATRRRFVMHLIERWTEVHGPIPWETMTESILNGTRTILAGARKWLHERDIDSDEWLEAIHEELDKKRPRKASVLRALMRNIDEGDTGVTYEEIEAQDREFQARCEAREEDQPRAATDTRDEADEIQGTYGGFDVGRVRQTLRSAGRFQWARYKRGRKNVQKSAVKARREFIARRL